MHRVVIAVCVVLNLPVSRAGGKCGSVIRYGLTACVKSNRYSVEHVQQLVIWAGLIVGGKVAGGEDDAAEAAHTYEL